MIAGRSRLNPSTDTARHLNRIPFRREKNLAKHSSMMVMAGGVDKAFYVEAGDADLQHPQVKPTLLSFGPRALGNNIH